MTVSLEEHFNQQLHKKEKNKQKTNKKQHIDAIYIYIKKHVLVYLYIDKLNIYQIDISLHVYVYL